MVVLMCFAITRADGIKPSLKSQYLPFDVVRILGNPEKDVQLMVDQILPSKNLFENCNLLAQGPAGIR